MIYRALQEERAQVFDPLRPRDPSLARLFGMGQTRAGVTVNDETALSSTALFAGVRFISENMASVPLKIYRYDDRSKVTLRSDPRWYMLQSSANPEQTAMEFREMMWGFEVLCGNAYAEIVEAGDGIARELWPITPWRVRVERVNGALVYHVRSPMGGERTLPAERVIHLRGFSRDGVLGVDVVEKMAQAIGIVLAAEEAAARFYGSGTQMAGVLEVPGALSEPAYERLKLTHRKLHAGVENWNRMAILEEGTKFHQLSTDPDKAQLIETRKFSISEVARILNLPPHVLKDLERSTFSNIEHQGQELVTYSFRPRAVRLEQVLEKRLLLPSERPTHFIRHNLDGFLRGDMQSRYNSYAIGRQWGWLSANDVREKEDWNPIDDGGDIYMAPINMLPADQFASAGLPDRTTGDEGRATPPIESREARNARGVLLRKRMEAAWRRTFRQRFDGLIRREAAQIRRAIKRAKDGGGFDEFRLWMQEFFRDNANYTAQDVKPMFAGFAQALYATAAEEVGGDTEADLDRWVEGYAERFGVEEAERSQGQLVSLIDNVGDFDEAVGVMEERLSEWEVTRAEKVADWEANNLGNRISILAWGAAGITTKRWWTNSGACPICQQMSGRLVSISAPFLSAGGVVDPDDGETAPLQIERNYAAPPLHRGCACSVVPG